MAANIGTQSVRYVTIPRSIHSEAGKVYKTNTSLTLETNLAGLYTGCPLKIASLCNIY